jgi:hypothetical protein
MNTFSERVLVQSSTVVDSLVANTSRRETDKLEYRVQVLNVKLKMAFICNIGTGISEILIYSKFDHGVRKSK